MATRDSKWKPTLIRQNNVVMAQFNGLQRRHIHNNTQLRPKYVHGACEVRHNNDNT